MMSLWGENGIRFRLGQSITVVGVCAMAVLITACGNGDGKPEPAVGRGPGEEAIFRSETDGLRDTGLETASSSPAEPFAVDGTRDSPDGAAQVDIVVPALALFSKEIPDSIWRVERCSLDEGSITGVDSGAAGGNSPRITYEPVNCATELQCFRGVCEVGNGQVAQRLTDGQTGTATVLTAPTEPEPMTPAEIQEFTSLPEVTSGAVLIPTPQAPLPTLTPGR